MPKPDRLHTLRYPRLDLHSPYSEAEAVVALRLRPSGRRTNIPPNLAFPPTDTQNGSCERTSGDGETKGQPSGARERQHWE
jgi:hypothetical protein